MAGLVTAVMLLEGILNRRSTSCVATGILERLDWEFFKTVIHQDGRLALYRCKL